MVDERFYKFLSEIFLKGKKRRHNRESYFFCIALKNVNVAFLFVTVNLAFSAGRSSVETGCILTTQFPEHFIYFHVPDVTATLRTNLRFATIAQGVPNICFHDNIIYLYIIFLGKGKKSFDRLPCLEPSNVKVCNAIVIPPSNDRST